MHCRTGCGACCIAPSIARPFHGMPEGKPAGVRCVHLDDAMQCRLFGDPRRPAVCGAFRADESCCGENRQQALAILTEMEILSQPD